MMKIKAVRLHEKNDLRFEEIDLRDINEDEMLMRVMTDSLCMSTYKAVIQGTGHRVVPADIAEHPVIVGHEFCGVVKKVGSGLADLFKASDVLAVQPKSDCGPRLIPGYSSGTYGGDATYTIIPGKIARGGLVVKYRGDAYYKASLAEPIACIIYALHMNYHIGKDNKTHEMGVKEGGTLAVLAGGGPMGLGVAEAAMAMKKKPSRIILTDIDEYRVDRAKSLLKFRNGITGEVVNTGGIENVPEYLMEKNGRKPFDDIFIMAPVREVIELADTIAGEDACINFFAGPSRKDFSANINFYPVHYSGKKIIGTSGSEMSDFLEALEYIRTDAISVSFLVSHIGGLNAVAETTMNLPNVPGGKKLIYCNKDIPLTAIEEFGEKGKTDPFFLGLHRICAENNMVWNKEAEEYVLANAKNIQETENRAWEIS
jgi:threonine dehydrogenase-like Zn-dependent dehydrogenase